MSSEATSAATGRDRIWALALEIANAREDRGWCRKFGPETVAAVADDRDLSTSTRTIRRVLDAMAETGILRVASDGENRLYILSTSNLAPVDTSVAGPTSPFSDTRLIYHLFADTGVESEPLSAYGRVVRVGLDPRENRFSDAIRADATDPPLEGSADLAVFHPPCQPWSPATRISGTQDDHPKLIEDCRDLAPDLADEWIIENVPEAPLRDPVRLDGSMFNLPVEYRRAFETSFSCPAPPTQPTLEDFATPFERDDGTMGLFRGEKDYWRTVKQVSGDYPSKPLKHSGIPAPYVHYLAHWWLRAEGGEAE